MRSSPLVRIIRSSGGSSAVERRASKITSLISAGSMRPSRTSWLSRRAACRISSRPP